MENVRLSLSVTLLLTPQTVFRPWVACEIYTGMDLGLPFVPVNVGRLSSASSSSTARSSTEDGDPEEAIRSQFDERATKVLQTTIGPEFSFKKYSDMVRKIADIPMITFESMASGMILWTEASQIATTVASHATRMLQTTTQTT
jgi:hypothetical protein